MNSLSLLASSNYIILNKDLIKALGLHEAVIIGELCSQYIYWENINQLVDGEYFYATREKIEEKTCINAYYQRVAIKKMEEKGILTLKRMGIPCKIYYKINEEKLLECIKTAKDSVVYDMNDKKKTQDITSNLPNKQQDTDNTHINNNNINKKINNNNNTHENFKERQKKRYAKLVTMTEQEYKDLTKEYGEQTTKQLIEQLNLYKQAKGKEYESDYAAILYWVTERLRKIKKKNESYKMLKNKTNSDKKANFNQREYPSDFLDSLYCNEN